MSGWVRDKFADSAAPKMTAVGKVRECAINTEMDGKVFTLDFPKGVHFVDKSTGRTFESLGGGKRRAISRSQYGSAR